MRQLRQSNFELLRIVAMFFIVMHHYVVNSGVLDEFSEGGGCLANYAFLKFIGAWGKTAINPFVILSGFFMCTRRLTIERYCKVLLVWACYSWIIFIALALCGYESFGPARLSDQILPVFVEVDVGFTASFMWFYLGIPIYNLIINGVDRIGLYKLTGFLLLMFVVPITFFQNTHVFHHVFWYMTMYFVGACIRLYPFKWMDDQKIITRVFVSLIVIASIGRCVGRIFQNAGLDSIAVVFRVQESSTLFAFAIGLFMFLFFRNINLAFNKGVNMAASCMFGVLCIHAESDAMRTWLWNHLCRVPEMAHTPLWILALHAFGCVVAIMVVCSLIDLVRQRWFEKPLIDFADKAIRRFNAAGARFLSA